MSLFSWFTGNKQQKVKNEKNKNINQNTEEINTNTMWPKATVRQNIIVKQRVTNSIDKKEVNNSSLAPHKNQLNN